MISVQPVILCGGSGTRLWPLSRAGFPKQFLCLTSKESLFQQAARRLAGLGADDLAIRAPIIITGEEHRFLAAEQLREAGHAKLDLTYQAAVRAFFETEKLDQVCLAAAKVGGIHANNTYE